jgi:hydroxyethylthiazole kinase-like uncharacterized protein yjeF
MILTCEQMQASEEAVFAEGASAEQLMERAGEGIARAVMGWFPVAGTVIVYCGTGHNGGDGLVAARVLADYGWDIYVRLVSDDLSDLKPLTLEHLEALGEDACQFDVESGLQPEDPKPVVILDALLGIGARGPLREAYALAAAELNELRERVHGFCFAIDIPSGVDGDTGDVHENAVMADVTLTIAQVKAGLVARAATENVGRIVVVPLDRIAPLAGQFDDSVQVLAARDLAVLLPRRSNGTYKTQCGRVGIIAGSRGMTGAAILTATAALRAGAGLVTLLADESVYEILAAKAPPEVMVKPVKNYGEAAAMDFDVLAIGPGLGKAVDDGAVANLILTDPRPLVVDADGLNRLAVLGMERISEKAGPRLLTPHPGEMERLCAGEELSAQAFAEKYGVTLLLKGTHTHIAERGGILAINTCGHPGMATGGCGDVLTGICAALWGQGLSAYDAACMGAWLSGRSAEIAVASGVQSWESFAAGDIVTCLGAAFGDLRAGRF